MKRRVEDLAVFGGAPLFAPALPTGQLDTPDVEDYIGHLRHIYRSRRLSNGGELVQQLEAALAEFHQVRHCIAVANAALGIAMLLQVLGEGRSGEVIMSALAYRGVPHLAKWAGFSPHFVDIDPELHTLDPQAVRAAISDATRCILSLPSFFSPGHVDDLCRVAESRNIPIFFDSVDSVACTFRGRPTGGFGDAEGFSLHATKLVNGFEGGYITTNDSELAAILVRQRDFNQPGADPGVAMRTPHVLGLNGKLNELHAAMALLSLARVEGLIERNKARYDAYCAELADIPGITVLPYPDQGRERHNFRMVVIRVDPEWPLTRDETVALLNKEGAVVRAYYSPPVHRLHPWSVEVVTPPMPAAERISKGHLHLPAGERVSLSNIHELAGLLEFVSARGDDIARSMRGARL